MGWREPRLRLVLKMVRIKAEAQDRELWRKQCCRAMATSVLVTVSLILLAVGVARVVLDQDNDEN
jgi:hypothetical protein